MTPLFIAPPSDAAQSAPRTDSIQEHLLSIFLDSFNCILQPFNSILLMGSAPMLFSEFQKKYPKAIIYTEEGARKAPYGNKVDCIIAFGFIDNSLQWLNFCHQALAPNGVLFFGTFGPDTYIEQEDLLDLPDLHTLGDGLLKANFFAPVTSSLRLEFTYPGNKQLRKDLDALGFTINHPHLTAAGKNQLHALKEDDECSSPRSLFLEITFGHGIKKQETPLVIETSICTIS